MWTLPIISERPPSLLMIPPSLQINPPPMVLPPRYSTRIQLQQALRALAACMESTTVKNDKKTTRITTVSFNMCETTNVPNVRFRCMYISCKLRQTHPMFVFRSRPLLNSITTMAKIYRKITVVCQTTTVTWRAVSMTEAETEKLIKIIYKVKDDFRSLEIDLRLEKATCCPECPHS